MNIRRRHWEPDFAYLIHFVDDEATLANDPLFSKEAFSRYNVDKKEASPNRRKLLKTYLTAAEEKTEEIVNNCHLWQKSHDLDDCPDYKKKGAIALSYPPPPAPRPYCYWWLSWKNAAESFTVASPNPKRRGYESAIAPGSYCTFVPSARRNLLKKEANFFFRKKLCYACYTPISSEHNAQIYKQRRVWHLQGKASYWATWLQS